MADTPPRTFPCPKCNRTLRASGEVSHDGMVLPTFQCDECLTKVSFAGETMELPLTFCVDRDGRAFDPAGEGDGTLRF